MERFLDEVKRRKVLPSAVAYVVFGWLVIQVGAVLVDIEILNSFVARWAAFVIVAGFPIALALAWFFDLSLSGIQVTGRSSAEVALQNPLPLATAPNRPPPPKKSIAVLPFLDMSAEQDQAYLGDGVAEEILNALVKVTPMKVAGRTSSFSFRKREMTVTEIGDALNVAYVLEGSVRRQGTRTRITAQLIRAGDGFQLWSETFEGDLTHIFDLQDNIAKSILDKLEVLLEIEQLRVAARLTRSPEAYEAFLRGRKLAQQQDGEGVLKNAIDFLEEAVQLDPGFAEAWAWLANANFFFPEHNETPAWKDHLDAGVKAAKEAFRLNPNLSDANLAMSYSHLLDLDFEKQWEARKRAHDLDPSSVPALHEFSMAYACLGLTEEAMPIMETANAYDPFSASFSTSIGILQWILGDFQAAEASLERSVNLGYALAATSKGLVLSSQGKPQRGYDYATSALARLKDQVPANMRSRPVQRLLCLAVIKNVGWAKWLVWLAMKPRVGNPRTPSDLAFKATLLSIGQVDAYFREVRERPNTYLSGAISMLWHPTEYARRARIHPDFPQFAEDIGLVRAWQKHGWPPQIQPVAGTKGSNLQFTCS